jgi:hypothetical protein
MLAAVCQLGFLIFVPPPYPLCKTPTRHVCQTLSSLGLKIEVYRRERIDVCRLFHVFRGKNLFIRAVVGRVKLFQWNRAGR